MKENDNRDLFRISASMLAGVDAIINSLDQRYPDLDAMTRTSFCRLCLLYVMDQLGVSEDARNNEGNVDKVC
jgi:hypothetical protein